MEKIQSAEAALLQELKVRHAKLTEVINTGDKVPENVQGISAESGADDYRRI